MNGKGKKESRHRAENKCRLSLRESSVFPFFRGAKGDDTHDNDSRAHFGFLTLSDCAVILHQAFPFTIVLNCLKPVQSFCNSGQES